MKKRGARSHPNGERAPEPPSYICLNMASKTATNQVENGSAVQKKKVEKGLHKASLVQELNGLQNIFRLALFMSQVDLKRAI